ncbi:GNAT family N-acetyltransferase [Tepidibacillus fermentans]|uniref:Acetyltransferase (GNAT) family protein n=1 Tax=Tepidibacillus fermentans TaxID=1281767 RepID=A0A4R3KIS4_9BACI|nr:GNAT family N-acetyltransferase [Tepidibacillus fermentans]TCS83112.1 acetyltransferase (GNAT) family protein [Tepidibacillus fermentans]
MEKLQLKHEEGFQPEIRDFMMKEWPSANEEVFGFRDQAKWKMEEHILTARIGDEIIGLAQFRIIGGVGYLSTLLVKEEYRGKGMVGNSLLAQFESMAQEKNCHKLGLKAYKDSRATKFFAKHGYQEEGVLKNDIHGINWVMMAKFV